MWINFLENLLKIQKYTLWNAVQNFSERGTTFKVLRLANNIIFKCKKFSLELKCFYCDITCNFIGKLLARIFILVPAEYFQHLDHTGQRMDRFERPELVLGTYEFIATSDYCKNNTLPKPPAIVFVIDVSYNNIKSGLVHLLCSQMKDIIRNLPKEEGQEKSTMRVGFITYNSSVHFYNIKVTVTFMENTLMKSWVGTISM